MRSLLEHEGWSSSQNPVIERAMTEPLMRRGSALTGRESELGAVISRINRLHTAFGTPPNLPNVGALRIQFTERGIAIPALHPLSDIELLSKSSTPVRTSLADALTTVVNEAAALAMDDVRSQALTRTPWGLVTELAIQYYAYYQANFHGHPDDLPPHISSAVRQVILREPQLAFRLHGDLLAGRQ